MDLNCKSNCSQEPLVTVIVPSYNHAAYITQTLESIFIQSYKNIELIVIDDNSQDNSVEVINNILLKHNFNFITHKINKGLSYTLNEAIRISKGKYISAIASDDYWPDYKIAKQVEVLESNPEYAVCFGKQVGFNNTGKLKEYENAKYRSGYIFNELITWKFSIPALTVMIRKSVFDVVGLYDPSIAIEDWYMWLKISKKYPIYFLNEVLGFYRLHENNMSKKLLWMINEKRKILDLWQEDNIYQDALAIHNVMSFWKLSGCNKLKAVSFLPSCSSSKTLKNKFFYKGIVKLFLPNRDYSI